MFGAIAGDVIGSAYEGGPPVDKAFPLFGPASRFTDDTVLTVAVASAIRLGLDYATALRRWGRRYPHAGYGAWFRHWLARDDAAPYRSYGNGSAMRVSPVGWAFDELERVEREAGRSAEVTHDHPEGIKGAQAVAAAVLLARSGQPKGAIRDLLEARFGYDCSARLDDLRRRGGVEPTCQATVPAAAVAFLEATDYEDAVRNAVSLGGDTDTVACVAGALAEAFYGGVPAAIAQEVRRRLDAALWAEVVAFAARYGVPLAGS